MKQIPEIINNEDCAMLENIRKRNSFYRDLSKLITEFIRK